MISRRFRGRGRRDRALHCPKLNPVAFQLPPPPDDPYPSVAVLLRGLHCSVRRPSKLSIKSCARASREVIAKTTNQALRKFGQFGDIHSNPSRLASVVGNLV